MKWKIPPIIKVYEALGAIADERITVVRNIAKIVSSSGGKTYEVIYNDGEQAITANDNGSYWQGYLGYPAIAFLMKKGVLKYDEDIAQLFKGIAWKDINTKFKDDYVKTEAYLKEQLGEQSWSNAQEFTKDTLVQIQELNLNKFPSKNKPPKGY